MGFSMDDLVWNRSTFIRNRKRLPDADVARTADLLSSGHFSVDGTLIEALASHKSYRPMGWDESPGGGGRNHTIECGIKLKN